MRMLRGCLPIWLFIACVVGESGLRAQSGQPLPAYPAMPGPMMQAGANPYGMPQMQPLAFPGPAPMGYGPQGPNPYQAAAFMTGQPYGMPEMAMPAAYHAGGEYGMDGAMMDGGMMDGGMMEGEYFPGGEGYCPDCNLGDCPNCGRHGYGDGVVLGFLRSLLPYAEGGRCAPRWYDITLDGMYVRREEVGQRVNFSTLTRQALGGTVVLSTDNLNYEEELGMRMTAALQLSPGAIAEFSYFGLFNWASVATVSDASNNLFSVYSNFGDNPINGFDQSDQAQFHSLRSSSTIDSFELSLRKRWTGPNCRLQGSYLAGARFVYLVDDLEFFTLGRNQGGTPIGRSDSDVRVKNSLTGFQVGGDLWANLVPGIFVGGDMKGGIYGNYAKQNTSVVALDAAGAPLVAPLNEEASNNDVAFVGEANLTFIYRVNPNVTIRAGYSFVYIDGIALAADNFNTATPFLGPRTVNELDDNSDAFYHGGFSGFEWMW